MNEIRSAAAPELVEMDGKKYIQGIAAKVNTPATIGSYFIEEIAPGAFDEVVNGDTRCLFNHDNNNVLGRTTSGTLQLSVTTAGDLFYKCEISEDRQIALDVYDMIKRGDVKECSFQFEVAESLWIYGTNGELDKRIIKKIKRLYDVAPVTFPAYDKTSVEAINEQRQQSKNSAPAPDLHTYKQTLKTRIL